MSTNVILVRKVSASAPPPDPAATLWVDGGAAGDDSRSKATVAASGGSLPWKTIGRAAWGSTNRAAPNAAEAAAAGDVVSILAGTYTTVGQDDRFTVAYQPANAGTSGNLITFRANGTVNLTYSSGAGPVIGARNTSYIKWQGFTINAATCPAETTDQDDSMVCFQSDLENNTGCVLERCTLTGVPATYSGNYSGVRIEGVTTCTVKHCTIASWTYTSPTNAAGIICYWTSGHTFEHNAFNNNGIGIYFKAPTNTVATTYMRFNKFTNNEQAGITYHRAPQTDAAPCYVYQNIFVGGGTGFFLKGWGTVDGTQPKYARVVNNTIYNTVSYGYENFVDMADDAALIFKNNIIHTAPSYAVNLGSTIANFTAARLTLDRNVYYNYGQMGRVDTTSYTLATWQSTYSQDNNSSNSDPLFVNAGAGDFHLQNSGQAALTIGRVVYSIGGTDGDTIPAGAYISGSETIGPT